MQQDLSPLIVIPIYISLHTTDRVDANGYGNAVEPGDDMSKPATRPKSDATQEHSFFTTSFTVEASPADVFAAINNPRAWWPGEFEGSTDRAGGEFVYRYKDLHASTQKITELVAGKRVVWHVTHAELSFVEDQNEWEGTDIVFDIAKNGSMTELRFAHVGLLPAFECYEGCSTAWSSIINDSLRSLITTGKGKVDLNL